MRIGILGGTFDPVHQGHLLLARAAKEQGRLDKVLFVPAFIPPHKAGERNLTPAPYRYRMVETAIREVPGLEISGIEFLRPDISYTVDTLRDLKKKYPRDKFFLILGADSVAEMPQWREAQEIQRMAKILAAQRPGVDFSVPANFDVQWLDMAACPLSSSGLRKQIEQGKLQNPADLPEGVEDFIRKKKLYGGRLCPSP